MRVTLEKPREDIEAQLLALKPGEELTDKQNTQITTTLINQIVTPAIDRARREAAIKQNYKIDKTSVLPDKEKLEVVVTFNISSIKS